MRKFADGIGAGATVWGFALPSGLVRRPGFAPKGAPTESAGGECPSARWRRQCWSAPGRDWRLHEVTSVASQPNRIPKRIVTDGRDEPSANRIGDDVARNTFHGFIVSQRMIVIAALPDLRWHACRPARGNRAYALESIDACRQARSVTQLNEPMHVVGHEHPRQQSCVSALRGSGEGACARACRVKFFE